MFNLTSFKIYRPTTTTGNKVAYADTGRTVSGRFGPEDTEFGAISGMGYGKSYRFFSMDTGVDLKEADSLVLGTDEYRVKGVQTFPHPPRHIEVSLEKIIKQ